MCGREVKQEVLSLLKGDFQSSLFLSFRFIYVGDIDAWRFLPGIPLIIVKLLFVVAILNLIEGVDLGDEFEGILGLR